MTAEPVVGFIGLGNIGRPMATRLIGWPGGLVVFDLVEEATAPFAAAGATVAGSVAEVGAAADVISVVVRDDQQVRAVVGELLTTAKPGTVVAIHSTIRAETAEALAETAATHGVGLVDAAVSGSTIGATDGTLAVLVGGDEATVERCRGPFGAFADLVIRFGPVGAGTRAKLARNLIQLIAFTATGEALRLADATGIDLADLGRVVRHSDAVTGGPGAVMLRDTIAPTVPGEFWHTVFSAAASLGEKDLDLALALGAELGVDLPMTAHARRHLAAALGVRPEGGEQA